MADVLIENATKIYPGDIVGVRGVNLHVQDKEFVVLVGPSGCGKSTTLRMIAGLEEITEGTVSIGGRIVNDVPPKDRDIAMVFQNYALYPHMTVYDNMAFGLKLRRYPKDEIRRRVKEAAGILGIDRLLSRKPKALSGGERQRVAVGRAIVRQPKAFLFDEPLSNLDAKLRVEMRAELSKLHHRLQTTMIYVTHDQVEAMTLGDRIVVLNAGEVQQIADPMTLYNCPSNRFVAGFIGTPAMNFVEGELEDSGSVVCFRSDGMRVRLDPRMAQRVAAYKGKKVIMGVRPEDIRDARHLAAGAGQDKIRTVVRVAEPLGDEVILYLAADSHELVAKVDPHHTARVDEVVDVVFNIEKIHLFDQATGINISAEPAEAVGV